MLSPTTTLVAFLSSHAVSAATTQTRSTLCPAGTKKYTLTSDLNFDNITNTGSGAAAIFEPVPSPYGNLDFQAFDYVNNIQEKIIGVVPHSSPNFIDFTAFSEGTAGTATITTTYAGSTAKEFDLYSTYVGCTLALRNDFEDPPVACDVTFTGFKGGKQSGVKTVAYRPSSSLKNQPSMFSGSFGSAFVGVQSVEVAAKIVGILSVAGADLAAILDDVSVQVRGCNKS